MGDPRIKILGIVNPTHQVKRPSFINIGDFAIWDFVVGCVHSLLTKLLENHFTNFRLLDEF